MATELPEAARKQLDAIRAQLLECLAIGARDHLEARSEFMRYGASQGGAVLLARPAIDHPDHAITKSYSEMFARAKQEGVELREIATVFRRTPGAPWRFETRWITVDEFATFTKAVAPLVEELRVALRALGRAQRPDWADISYDVEADGQRVLVMCRDHTRILLEPSAELQRLAGRVEATAQAQGLRFIGAGWTVERSMGDQTGEIESIIRVV